MSLVVLAALGVAGYVLVERADARPRTGYWCVRALDRAEDLDHVSRRLALVRSRADTALAEHHVAKHLKRSVRVRNLGVRYAHERQEYETAAARCRDAW